MKRNNLKFLILFTLVTATAFPLTLVSANSNTSGLRTSTLVQAEDNSTMIAIVGGDQFKSWGPTTWEYSLGQWIVGGQGGSYKGTTLEKLYEIRDVPEYPYLEYAPVLATNYNIVEYWPSEENSHGWNNTGGVHVVDFILRENIKFHDGSEWNATVAKWNIDRAYVLIGNLTGSEGAGHSDIMGHMCYKPGINYQDFFTPSWNYSHTYSNDPINGLPQTPQYYGKDNDPNKSWTNVSRTYLQDGAYSIINKTLIVKSADETASGTGGTIRIELNDFATDLRLLVWIEMISMEKYKDMFYTQIKDPFDWTGDQLACGTGAMKAIEVDKTNQIMKLERNDDYWNFTAMRAAGKMIVKEARVSYVSGATAGQLVTTAMVAGDADFALHGPPYGDLYPDQLEASPLLTYQETGVADSIEQLDFIQPNTDQAFRKAISYAFNYTQYLVSVKEGKAIRCDNLMGMNSVYINNSIVGSYHDLTIARAALLNDPKYGSVLAYAGIDESSTTTEWNAFAAGVGSLNATSKELFTFNYLHDIYNVDFTSTLETSIENIGIVFNKSGATPANPYGDYKTLSLWGMWYVMLSPAGRQAAYDNDLEAFFVDWPMPKTDLGYLDAFYTYTSQWMNVSGTMQWSSIPDSWNWGLINDSVLQVLIRALYFQNEAGRFQSYSDIQVRTGTQTYPSMFLSQVPQGYAVNKKFAIGWYWGGFDFSEVSIGPGYEVGGIAIEIPGFPIVMIFGVSLAAIAFVFMRKRKVEYK